MGRGWKRTENFGAAPVPYPTEPHQRTVCTVRRSRERGYYARQSTPALSIGDGLFASVRTAPFGTASHPFGPRASRHDSFAAAQDRRADSRNSAQGLGPDEQAVSQTAMGEYGQGVDDY